MLTHVILKAHFRVKLYIIPVLSKNVYTRKRQGNVYIYISPYLCAKGKHLASQQYLQLLPSSVLQRHKPSPIDSRKIREINSPLCKRRAKTHLPKRESRVVQAEEHSVSDFLSLSSKTSSSSSAMLLANLQTPNLEEML